MSRAHSSGLLSSCPNSLERYILNSQSKQQYGPDGSLTLYFTDQEPADAQEGNWLPTPAGAEGKLTQPDHRRHDDRELS